MHPLRDALPPTICPIVFMGKIQKHGQALAPLIQQLLTLSPLADTPCAGVCI
jgi:hypothetical protein